MQKAAASSSTLRRHWVIFPYGCSLWPCLDTQTCGGWNGDVRASGWKQSWGIRRENGWCYCNIFLFLAFLTALNWPTFYRKRSACTFFFFFFMFHEPWVVDVLSCKFQPTKMWIFLFFFLFGVFFHLYLLFFFYCWHLLAFTWPFWCDEL